MFTGLSLYYSAYLPLEPVSIPNGSVAFITGGSKGIGLETSKKLLALGFKVVVASRTPPPKDLGVHWLDVDLTRLKNVDGLVTRFKEKYGRLDLLIFKCWCFTWISSDDR